MATNGEEVGEVEESSERDGPGTPRVPFTLGDEIPDHDVEFCT